MKYGMGLGSLRLPEARSEVTDWDEEAELRNMERHGKTLTERVELCKTKRKKGTEHSRLVWNRIPLDPSTSTGRSHARY